MGNAIVRPVAASGILLFASAASATDYFVSPDGSGEACIRPLPCSLGYGVSAAVAGDTVVLGDGVYNEGLTPKNSGTEDAWITFKADECALPIIQGEGEDAPRDEDDNTPSGVYMSEATYLRFVGLASRHWDSGFTNGWTGEKTDSSNGHIEYINCIGEGNTRTGFAMYSAGGFTVRECISAHNGGSPTHSWSSGIQLYAVQGTAEQNILERNISFENADGQKNNDGSGFIVDEETQGATFINNIGFRNGGSCFRLTRSNNTRMINFSCYHNGMNPDANSPTNPGELYWTDAQSRDTTTLFNSIAAASGSDTDPEALRFPPTAGLSNNLTLNGGETPFFTDPEGTNPDFRPPAAAAAQIENLGSAMGSPNEDIGFDPKCIVKQDPAAPYQKSWWIYSVDYDYIRSIGGIAACFHPKMRTGGADLGAYELSGEPHVFSVPGSCIPPDPGPIPPEFLNMDGGVNNPEPAPSAEPSATASPTATGTSDGAGGEGSVGEPTEPGVTDPELPASAAPTVTGAAVPTAAPTAAASATAAPNTPDNPGSGGQAAMPAATMSNGAGVVPAASPTLEKEDSGCACRVATPRQQRSSSVLAGLLVLCASLARRRVGARRAKSALSS
jgi:hypothetical protein